MTGRLTEGCKLAMTIPPASRNNVTTNGTGVDTAGFRGDAALLVMTGAVADLAAVDLKAQESDDNSSYTDIPAAAVAQIAGDQDNTARAIGFRLQGRKRYIRGVGSLPSAGAVLYAVAVVLTGAESQPYVNSPAAVVVP